MILEGTDIGFYDISLNISRKLTITSAKIDKNIGKQIFFQIYFILALNCE